MNFISLNLLSTEPLYVQLKRSIRQAIVSKQLKHMERLPTEAEMRSIFGISTTVVRRAYDALVEQGLVLRVKGSGTYVNQRPSLRLTLPLFESEFSVPMTSQVFCVDKVKTLPSSFHDRVDSNEKQYWLIKRIYFYQEYPTIYQVIYLPQSLFPKLALDLDQSFSLVRFLQTKHNRPLGNLNSKYLTKKADAAEAFVLQLDAEAPLHYLFSVFYNDQKKPIAYFQSYMDGQQVALHSTPVYIK